MPKKMYANFSDEAYDDLMSGNAVDNNGLRSPKGSFYPDQPSFEPIDDRKEQLADAGVQMLILAGGALVFDIILPEVKRFTHEKVYPVVAEKWDNWQEKCRMKKAENRTSSVKDDNIAEDVSDNCTEENSQGRIINLDDYRKMA